MGGRLLTLKEINRLVRMPDSPLKKPQHEAGVGPSRFYNQVLEWITVKDYILIGRVHFVSKIGVIPQQ